MLAHILSLALLAGQSTPEPSATAPTVQMQPDTAVQLDDIEVAGQGLDSRIKDFVGEVAAPSRGRGIARWAQSLCIASRNFRPELGQYLEQRLSDIAQDLGLGISRPGCTPNVMIIATQDGPGLARDLVANNRRAFMPGAVGTDRGEVALSAFQTGDAPVRWWQVSVPVDVRTGQRTVRLPGDQGPAGMKIVNESRITTPIVDNLASSVVIVDLTRVAGVSQTQLADYVAMVTLAQIDPEAETQKYVSILNLFEQPDASPFLTDWDASFLEGIYDARRDMRNNQAATNEIARSIRRAHDQITPNN